MPNVAVAVLLFLCSYACGGNEEVAGVDVNGRVDDIFTSLEELEERQKIAARKKWEKLDVQSRAKLLWDAQQPLKTDISREEAEAIVEEVISRLTSEQVARIAENPRLLTQEEREEFVKMREKLIARLAQIGTPTIPLLVARVQNDPDECTSALDGLIRMREHAILPLLTLLEQTLQSGRTEVSVAIMWRLRQVRPFVTEIIPVCTKHLSAVLAKNRIPVSPTEDLIWTISISHAKDSVPLLVRALDCKKYVDTRGRPSDGPRIAAAKMLGLIADERAESALSAAAGNASPYLRLCAVGALATCGTRDAIPLLEEIARTDSYTDKGGVLITRQAAKEAVEKIRKRAEGGQPQA